MKTLFYIFLGGGAGSVLRFLISGYTQKWWVYNSFPMGTFLVNVLGCFLIGIFSTSFLKNDSLRFFLIAGFCGGFTTFSALSAESFSLWQSGNYTILLFYILLSILAGIVAVMLGMKISS